MKSQWERRLVIRVTWTRSVNVQQVWMVAEWNVRIIVGRLWKKVTTSISYTPHGMLHQRVMWVS